MPGEEKKSQRDASNIDSITLINTIIQVLFGTGDVIAQQLIEKKGADHDLPRTA